jgi:hypothetical protein
MGRHGIVTTDDALENEGKLEPAMHVAAIGFPSAVGTNGASETFAWHTDSCDSLRLSILHVRRERSYGEMEPQRITVPHIVAATARHRAMTRPHKH